MKKILFLLFPILFLSFGFVNEQKNSELNKGGFLKRSGNKIVNSSGEEIYLKGIAFGNWVWSNDPVPATHHSEDDFIRVKNMGMNTIRFYLNYLTLEDDARPFQYKEEGWKWIDQNIQWAKKHNLYLILNMHVPQGGFQSNGDGSELWNNKENQKRLKALWHNISKRYKNETIIAGYDLLNEPYTTKSKKQWEDLAQAITDTIRLADPNHLIIVERLNSIAGNWNNDTDMNFFLIKDNNAMYTFHFYSPIEYTHQHTSWTGLGEGGKYPDENVIEGGSNFQWYTATFNNPKLPPGNSDWKYFEGEKYFINDHEISLAYPALVGAKTGKGKVYFDSITINEYDSNKKFIRSIFKINLNDQSYWYFWSSDKSGTSELNYKTGIGDRSSLTISETNDDANLSGHKFRFIPKQNHYYSISGYMKGENIPTASNILLRIDFMKSNTEILSRNKNYLENVLLQFIQWGEKNNVPLYIGEFGVYRECFNSDKGGLIWVSDMLDLIKKHQMHFTYHTYHEDGFGLYYGHGMVDPEKCNLDLINLFTRKLK